jgi:predicted ATPase/DNA-binding winged helix-turn-helix (wHTH) protein
MVPVSSVEGGQGLAFGAFQLLPDERLLLRDGAAVRVGSRSLDILMTLIARRGEIVGKDDLVAAVWPDTIVEESALRVHISTLRKALGDGVGDVRLIANVPGRGYCFVAPVTAISVSGQTNLSTAQAAEPGPADRSMVRRLPASVGKIIGRDALIGELSALLADQRLLTIVGPGGMGKTTVALAVAERVAAAQDCEVAFVDLAPLADADLAPGAVASALGLAVRSADPVQEIANAIQHRRLLLVVDSCEHLVDAAAALAETLLGRVPGATILATSREALRAGGEWVHRLQSLAAPPVGTTPTAEEALGYPAVQMFVERASATLGGFRLDDAQAPVVAEICRRLDGIALAIELATGRLDAMGIPTLAKSLENCFQVLTRGRRTALPRHQTLRGAIDWSYGILPPSEQATLRRLGAFNGAFTLRAALKVAGEDGISPDLIEDRLLNLVAKSLVATELDGDEPRYRLFDTTRTYVHEKLDEAGEGAGLRRRHAAYYRDLFGQAEAEWETRPTVEWLVDYAGQLDNLRAALDWAFSAEGEGAIGVALTVAAVPLWFQLSLVDEGIGRVQRALAWLEASPRPDARAKMRLHAVLGFPQMRAITGFPSGAKAWRSALAIAEDVGDTDYQARALWALWTDRVNNGEAAEALTFADRFAALARTCPEAADPLIAQRVRGWSLLMLGRLDEAHADIVQMLRSYVPPTQRSHVARFQYDQRSTARITLARTLWLSGHADQALADVADNLAEVMGSDHTLSVAHVLSDAACFVALWCGDLALAERYTGLLRVHTAAQALDVWHTYGDCFEGEILLRRGQTSAGLALIRPGVDRLRAAGFVCYHTAFLGVFADGLRSAGRLAEAQAVIDEMLDLCARTGEAWCLPELLRLSGEIHRDQGLFAQAEQNFFRSLEIAGAQGALAWELRTTVSLARTWIELGRVVEARGCLTSVMARFSEGFGAIDYLAAGELLARLDD